MRLLFSLLFLLLSLLQRPSFASKKNSYVVYLGRHAHGHDASQVDYERATDSHLELLGSFLGSKEKARDAMFYSYTKHVNGFAAILEEEVAEEISKHPEVVSIFLNKVKKLHTTRSWEFMGLERDGTFPANSIWKETKFGEDIVIANLDTGVWPESESFKDDGMGPVPSKWKGFCENNTRDGVPCNRKLIGARYFVKAYEAEFGPVDSSLLTARDFQGHGTHTLSTAGGRFVNGVNIFGYGNGTAKGGSPNARVAAYKVCWEESCSDADQMAAIDAAIHDGVDVISISTGGVPSDFVTDGTAIASLHAVENGIIVVCAAGNSGPTEGTVLNTAPWILTVGSGTMDRVFMSNVCLGNNGVLMGESVSEKSLPVNKFYPLIDDRHAGPTMDASFCTVGSLDRKKVKGKIVVCHYGEGPAPMKGKVVADAGGVGMIVTNTEAYGNELDALAHVLPAVHISWASTRTLLSYIESTESPTASITRPTTVLGRKPAPFVAASSSAGPNPVTPYILKPDLIAPGVNVLAAYPQSVSPSNLESDPRRVPYNVASGTSMSCPHVSGIAGLLKALHPDWSPSAIRSAMMTTARTSDNADEPLLDSSFAKATPFSYGSGHVQPNDAMDPGLVYDLTHHDYLNFLCSLGYNTTQMANFTTSSHPCKSNRLNILDVNYPSIAVPGLSGSVTVSRTVRNVGSPGTYTSRVDPPRGIQVRVKPKSLKFDYNGQEKTFKVTLQAKVEGGVGEYVFGRLVWSDGKHYVGSPIAVLKT